MKVLYREKISELVEIIVNQKITLVEKQKMLEDYRKEIKPDEELNTCGICGYRDYKSEMPVSLVNLAQLSLLKMSSEQYASYMAIDPAICAALAKLILRAWYKLAAKKNSAA